MTRPPKISALGANLAATWIAQCEAGGMSRADALRHLNVVTRCRYTSSRLNEWLRGDRLPAREARLAILHEVLPGLLTDLGVRLTPD
ncbi:MAG: hypothetical protein Q7R45_04110, partial [Sulfuricaulis sp.]|nr:hypothetical protein [Sulfuricaulis sp.]